MKPGIYIFIAGFMLLALAAGVSFSYSSGHLYNHGFGEAYPGM